MSRASNSLKATDVTATPIKLKYSASYSDTTICDTGIYAKSGINGPVTITGSVPAATLRYWSIRHLYYSNFLTGSYQTTTSSLDNSLQSTAASGTFEGNTTASASADIRYFPTESGAKIKIVSIPRSSFGEKTSRKSFSIASAGNYNLVDDGNGNIIDTLNANIHVGNIIYAQGFVIITNPNYYCAMDGGPTTFAKSYTFDISESPKSFNPILGAIPDCAPVVSSSLALLPSEGSLFPSTSINPNGTVTLSESDPLTNETGLYRTLYELSSTYCGVSDAQPIDVQITDCALQNLSAVALACGITGLTLTFIPPSATPTPTLTPTATVTPSVTRTPIASTTPTVTPTITPSVTITPSITVSPGATPTPTVTPSVTITPSITVSPAAGAVSIVVNNAGVYPYPVSAGNGSASGTISNTTASTVYVYVVFNSGGNGTGSIGSDGGNIDTVGIPMSGTISSFGQTIYSATYFTLTAGSIGLSWNLSKSDGLSSGATLRLGYSTTPGGSVTLL